MRAMAVTDDLSRALHWRPLAVVQRIERLPPKRQIQVRFLSAGPSFESLRCSVSPPPFFHLRKKGGLMSHHRFN
jgi:hypothetical protein